MKYFPKHYKSFFPTIYYTFLVLVLNGFSVSGSFLLFPYQLLVLNIHTQIQNSNFLLRQ